MTIIKSQKELDEMVLKAELNIASGNTYSLKEVYQKLYLKKEKEEYV